MHTVLHLQTDGAIAEHNQALKQRLGETSPGSLLVHDNGTELLVIPDEYNLLTAKYERYHTLCKGTKGDILLQMVTTYQVPQPVSLRRSKLF